MKQIKVDDEVWKRLYKLKIDLNLKSLNDVVLKLQKLVNKLSLMKDLQILVQGGVKVRK